MADNTINQNLLTANQNEAWLVTNQITPYSQIEHFLADIVNFLFNIKKYSADRLVLDQSELAKHEISSLIRLQHQKHFTTRCHRKCDQSVRFEILSNGLRNQNKPTQIQMKI